MQIVAKVSNDRVRQVLGRIPSALEVELYQGLRDIGAGHLVAMKRRMERGTSSVGFGQHVRSSTGALQRSFAYEIRGRGTLGDLGMKVFSAGNVYANIQEFGGTITPKKAQFLAVPMPAIRRPNGSIVGKYSGGPRSLMRSEKETGRDPAGSTFVMRDERGKLFIAERVGKGKNAKIKLLWALVKRVRLRGGLGWFATWRGADADHSARLQLAARRALAKAHQ